VVSGHDYQHPLLAHPRLEPPQKIGDLAVRTDHEVLHLLAERAEVVACEIDSTRTYRESLRKSRLGNLHTTAKSKPCVSSLAPARKSTARIATSTFGYDEGRSADILDLSHKAPLINLCLDTGNFLADEQPCCRDFRAVCEIKGAKVDLLRRYWLHATPPACSHGGDILHIVQRGRFHAKIERIITLFDTKGSMAPKRLADVHMGVLAKGAGVALCRSSPEVG
jgi:hypothetical protein